MTTIMSPRRARGTRMPQLEDDLKTGSACKRRSAPAWADWFRHEEESDTAWERRSTELVGFCRRYCPVETQCREMALRSPEAPDLDGDIVRGGLTGDELQARYESQRKAIKRAIAKDEEFAGTPEAEAADAQRRKINAKALSLVQSARSTNTGTGVREANNAQVRKLSAELAQLRAARRASTGWSTVA